MCCGYSIEKSDRDGSFGHPKYVKTDTLILKFLIWFYDMGLDTRRFANNKDADQPAHPRSLISAFVTRLLERIISTLAMREISIF